MKHTLLLIATLFTYTFTQAQSQNDYAYSAGFRLLAIGEYPKLLNESRSSDEYRTSAFNSLIFKFNDNQISYRIQASRYRNDDYKFFNNCKDCNEVSGTFKDFTAKLGFEKNITYGTVQPFYGLDLGFKKITFDGTERNINTQASQESSDVAVEKNGGVIYPFLGLKVNVVQSRLTLSAEVGMDILYSYDKETRTAADNTVTINEYRRWGFYNKP